MTPQEQTIVNDKLLHSSAVAQQSYMATTDAAVIKATALIEKVVFAEKAKIPIKKAIIKENIPVQVTKKKVTLNKQTPLQMELQNTATENSQGQSFAKHGRAAKHRALSVLTNLKF